MLLAAPRGHRDREMAAVLPRVLGLRLTDLQVAAVFGAAGEGGINA